MKRACIMALAVLIAPALPVRAQDAPPPDILNRIIGGLGGIRNRVVIGIHRHHLACNGQHLSDLNAGDDRD